MPGKIDVHTHALPDFFYDALHQPGNDTKGVPKINWSLDATRESNIKFGVSTSILSLSAPGPEVAEGVKGGRILARQYNEWASKLTASEPASFGYFAAVPSLTDTKGCVEEINYAFDKLQADGICLFTTYDGRYLGDPDFEPIWKELDRRAAVVFIHPNMPPGLKLAHPMMQPPVFDFPHETGRTAAHMIMTGMKSRYPNVKIILSHGGGTLPILSERLASLEANLFAERLLDTSPRDAKEIVRLAKSFYFDTALCGTANVLDTLTRWAPSDHILFGSDFPYATVEAEFNTRELEEYSIRGDLRESYYFRNGLKLLPRLQDEKFCE